MAKGTRAVIVGIAGTVVVLPGACDNKPSAASSSLDAKQSSTAAGVNAADTYKAVHAALGTPLLEAVRGDGPAPVLLKEHARDIDRLVEASRSATCDFGVDYTAGMDTMMPHLAMVRDLARVLKADAARLLAAGDLDGAAKRIATIERIAAHVLQPAHSIIELLVVSAVAQLGTGFVADNASVANAPWKTDIQQALVDLEAQLAGRAATIVRLDGEMVVKALRAGKMVDMRVAGGRDWTGASQAERDAAAATLAAIHGEVGRAWDAPGGAVRLGALEQQAKNEGVGDLMSPLAKTRRAVDDLQAALVKANRTLGG